MTDENGAPVGGKTERIVLELVKLPLSRADTPLADDHIDIAWQEIGRAAGTEAQAVAQVAGDREGQFRAVPARSWRRVVEQSKPEQPAIRRKLIES